MNEGTKKLKAKAKELGFTKVGVASALSLDPESQRLEEWLARGFHADMIWMERNRGRRKDVREIVPGAQSVVSVALNYFTPTKHADRPGIGKISRYAWGDDYHDVMSERLHRLHKWLDSEYPGSEGKVYVDTGPVMDKAWAQRAGIGWIGKHSNVITPDVGSWVFLGEIISTIPFVPDESAVDRCGTCTLCLEACPTGAIPEAYVVDSNRCISYLTIEHRGDIPEELPGSFSGWIYGCDICQDVCPWNTKFSRSTEVDGFAGRKFNIEPDLQTWRKMTQTEFSKNFKGSPIKRTKLRGLRRNIRAVLKEDISSRKDT